MIQWFNCLWLPALIQNQRFAQSTSTNLESVYLSHIIQWRIIFPAKKKTIISDLKVLTLQKWEARYFFIRNRVPIHWTSIILEQYCTLDYFK